MHETDSENEMAVRSVPRIKREPAQEDLEARITTTHDVYGGGDPRLVMSFHDSINLGIMLGDESTDAALEGREATKEFPLKPGLTTIGSAVDSDIRLPGLKLRHAEICRDEFDECNILDLSGGDTAVDGGREASCIPLRTGRRVSLGEWTLVYQRAEFADHGSPFGGHSGGELEGPLAQNVPRPRGTSSTGGSEPSATDPGEYF